LIYIFVAYHAATGPIFPETSAISHLANLVKESRYTEIEKRFPKRPFYIRSISGRIKWDLLWARKLMAQQKLKEAYEIYFGLLSLHLFEEEKNNIKLKQVFVLLLLEKNNIKLKQVFVLLLLGDTNKAKFIFERTKQKIDQNEYHEILCLQSVFEERTGEFEKARQSLLSAVGEYDNVKDIQLATIYNNLGRMEKMLGNTTNTPHYYRKSAELACHFKEKSLIHIAYPNIIDTYLLLGDKKNAVLFLGKYSDLIDKDNIDDLLRFNNYKLEYARQIKDKILLLDTLSQGRIEILPKIPAQEQLVFEISELRIRWNNKCGWNKKLFWVRHSLPEYLKLEFPVRYLMIKEIFNVLLYLARTNNLGQFRELFSQLLNFMERSKKDIDLYLLELPDYCVDERCFWEKEKAFLRGIQRADEPQINLIDFYDGMFDHLRNIKDIQFQHGNPLPAIEADLNIADESMEATQKIQDKVVRNYLRKNMQKHLDNACRDFEKFRRHLVSIEYIVRFFWATKNEPKNISMILFAQKPAFIITRSGYRSIIRSWTANSGEGKLNASSLFHVGSLNSSLPPMRQIIVIRFFIVWDPLGLALLA
jgi:tetratricopeptide (TPR) repeat protein